MCKIKIKIVAARLGNRDLYVFIRLVSAWLTLDLEPGLSDLPFVRDVLQMHTGTSCSAGVGCGFYGLLIPPSKFS